MGIPMPVGTGMFRLQHRSMRLEVAEDDEAVGEGRRTKAMDRGESRGESGRRGAGRISAGLAVEAETLELPKRPPLLMESVMATA